MHIAAGRSFVEQVENRARTIVPDLQWVTINGDGSCSESPEKYELLVLAGDSYTTQFVEAVLKIPTVRWAHTEDAGTDGLFYDTMRACGSRSSFLRSCSLPDYLPTKRTLSNAPRADKKRYAN